MLKQFDTVLIQASMTYSEYVIRSLLYLFREMLNLFIFFFFSWYLFFDILYVFQDFLSTSFFDSLFSGFSWYLAFWYFILCIFMVSAFSIYQVHLKILIYSVLWILFHPHISFWLLVFSFVDHHDILLL